MQVEENITRLYYIQKAFLLFIENDDLAEENYQNLTTILTEFKIGENQHDLELFLYLLLTIANNHHRSLNFFEKIFQILILFKNQMKNFFTSFRIFNIFKSNKRILLFLIKEEVIIVDKSIVYILFNRKYNDRNYIYYFYPEIKSFLDEKEIKKIENEDISDLETKRNNEFNEDPVYNYIKNDIIEDFIIYVNKTNLLLNSTINCSFYETNLFVLKNKLTLIEYAAFFGSLQILKYLHLNRIEITQNTWIAAIHSQNPELIRYLEENEKIHEDPAFMKILINEAIKCHHNDIKDYFQNYYVNNEDEIKPFSIFCQSLKYYNYAYLRKDMINKNAFANFCKYNYYTFAQLVLENSTFDINQIFQLIFSIILQYINFK